MNGEKEARAPSPQREQTDKEIFDEVMSDLSGYTKFQNSLGEIEAESDPEDVEHARENADHLRIIFDLLTEGSPSADLDQRERETFSSAQALASHSIESLFSLLTALRTPVAKGDALDALAALIEATFYIGKCSTAAQQADMKDQAEKKTRGAVEKTQCETALRELFDCDPRSRGLSHEQIRAQVAARLTGGFSASTLSRALRNAWK